MPHFPTEDNIFYADAHDYEMMCLKNESTRQEIFENLAITYNEDLWKQIFQELNILPILNGTTTVSI